MAQGITPCHHKHSKCMTWDGARVATSIVVAPALKQFVGRPVTYQGLRGIPTLTACPTASDVDVCQC